MTRVLKISPNNRFPGQATSLASHIGTANKIVKEKLTSKQLDLFKRTVFGRFVDMDLVFSSPLVHHILLREVKDERPDAMSFNLNRMIATFSKEEFLLVTGLWPSPTKLVKRVEATKSLRTKYFGNELVVDMNPVTFEERYKNLNFYDDLDAVKITLVYYTELAMMGKDRTKGIINKSLLDDVEDLKYYNSLDWGHILWERTFRGLQNALKNKVDMYKKKVKLNKNYNVKYSLPGFPHAFQVWAYEIIPSIAGKAVTRLNNDAVPRILRWSCSYSLPSKLLQRKVFNSPMIVISPALIMSDAEKQFRDTQVDERPVYVVDQAERTPSVIDISEDSDGPKDAQGHFDDHDLHNEGISSPHYEHVQGSHAKRERSDKCDPHDDHDVGNNSKRFMRDHVDEDHLPEPEMSMKRCKREGKAHEEHNHNVFSYLQSLDMSMKRCKREGKAHEEHNHNVFSYLQSLDSRVSRVEGTLKEMKSDLQTITSLLRSCCKSKNMFNDENGACDLDSSHPEPTAPSPHIVTTTTGLDDERAIRTAECEIVQDVELRKWGFKFTLA